MSKTTLCPYLIQDIIEGVINERMGLEEGINEYFNQESKKEEFTLFQDTYVHFFLSLDEPPLPFQPKLNPKMKIFTIKLPTSIDKETEQIMQIFTRTTAELQFKIGLSDFYYKGPKETPAAKNTTEKISILTIQIALGLLLTNNLDTLKVRHSQLIEAAVNCVRIGDLFSGEQLWATATRKPIERLFDSIESNRQLAKMKEGLTLLFKQTTHRQALRSWAKSSAVALPQSIIDQDWELAANCENRIDTMRARAVALRHLLHRREWIQFHYNPLILNPTELNSITSKSWWCWPPKYQEQEKTANLNKKEIEETLYGLSYAWLPQYKKGAKKGLPTPPYDVQNAILCNQEELGSKEAEKQRE